MTARRLFFAITITSAVGCGRFLGIGGSDDEPTPAVEDDAASPDGSAIVDGAATAEGGNVATDGASDADAAEASTFPDGAVCVASGICAKSVFDCCAEMEDVSAASCGGICGVDICCF
jgi:hypothetical protein